MTQRAVLNQFEQGTGMRTNLRGVTLLEQRKRGCSNAGNDYAIKSENSCLPSVVGHAPLLLRHFKMIPRIVVIDGGVGVLS